MLALPRGLRAKLLKRFAASPRQLRAEAFDPRLKRLLREVRGARQRRCKKGAVGRMLLSALVDVQRVEGRRLGGERLGELEEAPSPARDASSSAATHERSIFDAPASASSPRRSPSKHRIAHLCQEDRRRVSGMSGCFLKVRLALFRVQACPQRREGRGRTRDHAWSRQLPLKLFDRRRSSRPPSTSQTLRPHRFERSPSGAQAHRARGSESASDQAARAALRAEAALDTLATLYVFAITA